MDKVQDVFTLTWDLKILVGEDGFKISGLKICNTINSLKELATLWEVMCLKQLSKHKTATKPDRIACCLWFIIFTGIERKGKAGRPGFCWADRDEEASSQVQQSRAADKILKGRCGCSIGLINSRKFPLNPVCCGSKHYSAAKIYQVEAEEAQNESLTTSLSLQELQFCQDPNVKKRYNIQIKQPKNI